MTLIIETGVGVRDAQSYTSVSYADSYLIARGRETENSWSTSTSAIKEAALIAATDYVDKRFFNKFKGFPATSLIEVVSVGSLVFSGSPVVGETLLLGDYTYTFVNSLNSPGDVIISSSASNLVAAINGDSGSGSLYGSDTPQSRHASAVAVGGVVTLVA